MPNNNFILLNAITKVIVAVCFIQLVRSDDQIHGGCGFLDQKVYSIQIDDNFEQKGRLLQQSVHQFNIAPQFPYQFLRTYNNQVLERMILIASNYLRNLLKVTNIDRQLTKFPSGGNCGDAQVDSKFYDEGFDQSNTDSVLFAIFEDRSDVSYVAKAGACSLSKWPTYGIVYMNKHFVKTDLDRKGQFHSNVVVVIHQLTHVYAFSSSLYDLYYVSYSSTTQLSLSQVIATANGRLYIITNNVKNYVSNFFNCNTGTIGAQLQEDGGSGSASSHWERKVYLDQLMTASVWPSGLRVTQLTTNLFLDTGFYYSVQVSLADKSQFGKNEGCNFMTGQSNAAPYYCSTTNTNTCDFYSFYGGTCSTDSFADNAGYIQAYTNQLCPFSQYGSSSQQNNVFNALSRCIMTNSGFGNQPQCFISKYDQASNSVNIYQIK